LLAEEAVASERMSAVTTIPDSNAMKGAPMRTCKLALAGSILAIAAAVLVAPTPPAFAAGALAEGGGSFGFSRNHESMRVAERMALGNCGNAECHIVMTFAGSCVAYASASNGASGWARRENESLARDRALENCIDHGGRDCKVRTNLGYECDGM